MFRREEMYPSLFYYSQRRIATSFYKIIIFIRITNEYGHLRFHFIELFCSHPLPLRTAEYVSLPVIFQSLRVFPQKAGARGPSLRLLGFYRVLFRVDAHCFSAPFHAYRSPSIALISSKSASSKSSASTSARVFCASSRFAQKSIVFLRFFRKLRANRSAVLWE